MKQSDSSYSSKDQESKAYVVEFEEDDKNKPDFKLATNDQTTYKFNFNKITKPNITITELDDKEDFALVTLARTRDNAIYNMKNLRKTYIINDYENNYRKQQD